MKTALECSFILSTAFKLTHGSTPGFSLPLPCKIIKHAMNFPFFPLVYLKEQVCKVAVMRDDVALSFWKGGDKQSCSAEWVKIRH